MSARDLTEAVEAAADVEIGMRQIFHQEDGSTTYTEFARVPLGADAAAKVIAAAAPLIAAQVREQIIETLREQIIETLRAERDEITGSRGPQDEPIAAETAFLSGLDHAIEVLEDEQALPTERRDT